MSDGPAVIGYAGPTGAVRRVASTGAVRYELPGATWRGELVTASAVALAAGGLAVACVADAVGADAAFHPNYLMAALFSGLMGLAIRALVSLARERRAGAVLEVDAGGILAHVPVGGGRVTYLFRRRQVRQVWVTRRHGWRPGDTRVAAIHVWCERHKHYAFEFECRPAEVEGMEAELRRVLGLGEEPGEAERRAARVLCGIGGAERRDLEAWEWTRIAGVYSPRIEGEEPLGVAARAG